MFTEGAGQGLFHQKQQELVVEFSVRNEQFSRDPQNGQAPNAHPGLLIRSQLLL